MFTCVKHLKTEVLCQRAEVYILIKGFWGSKVLTRLSNSVTGECIKSIQLGAVLLILGGKRSSEWGSWWNHLPSLSCKKPREPQCFGGGVIVNQNHSKRVTVGKKLPPKPEGCRETPSAVVSCYHYKWTLTLEFELDGDGFSAIQFQENWTGAQTFYWQ